MSARSVDAVVHEQEGALHHDGDTGTRETWARVTGQRRSQSDVADICGRIDQQHPPQRDSLRFLSCRRVRVGQSSHPPILQA